MFVYTFVIVFCLAIVGAHLLVRVNGDRSGGGVVVSSSHLLWCGVWW